MNFRSIVLSALMMSMAAAPSLVAQDKSVRPGINDSFRDPNVKEYVERFEVESREVFNRREEILKACEIEPGQTVADIGAGTGIFTRLFSKAVGNDGNVIAVDISQNFLDHIQKVAREQGQTNIGTLLCSEDSTKLTANTVDLAYICDTYHHFEYPFKTMDSLFAAMKPGGRVVLVDFKRIEGETSDWTMNHVRAGQEVFEAEVLKAGFVKIGENKELLKDNYFVIFQKPKTTLTSKPASTTERKLVFPIVDGIGGVLPRPQAAEQPRAGAKVVFDVTNDTKSADINKGLDRVARLLNLYGSAGLKASDVKIALVLHGESTKAALSDSSYKTRFEVEKNPNLPLIKKLQELGVEIYVCGQALNYKNFEDSEVADQIPIASAALTVVTNKQADGFSYIPVH